MKKHIVISFSEGFKDSFRLSTSLVKSVSSTISHFAEPKRSNPDTPQGSSMSDGRRNGKRKPIAK